MAFKVTDIFISSNIITSNNDFFFVRRKRNYIENFMIRLTNSSLCLSASGEKDNGFWKRNSNIILSPCLRVKSQVWYETDKHELVLGQILCLEASSASSSSPPVLNKCHEMGGKNRHLFLFINFNLTELFKNDLHFVVLINR